MKMQAQPSPDWTARFTRFANSTARIVGSPMAFLLAILSVVFWAVLGPLYHYSESWQLVINSVSNIVAYVMVFLLQNTQNRDSIAMNLKLDELIRSMGGARNDLIEIEHLSDRELTGLAERLRRAAEARQPHPAAATEDQDALSRPPAA